MHVKNEQHRSAFNIQFQLEKLKHVGMMMSAEKNTEKLIDLILEASMEVTSSDAGSVYIKERYEEEEAIKFMRSRNNSKSFPFEEQYLKIDKNSIAGYCAFTGQPYIFNEMREVTKKMNLKYNSFFDQRNDYVTTNMMVIPMLDIHNEVLGVVQLINKKKDYTAMLVTKDDYIEQIIPYDSNEMDLVKAMASQAGMLIERSKLLESIQKLFDSFVESMVVTIEKRDPTTSGHSMRVAKYVKELAKAVNQSNDKAFKAIHFDEKQIKELYYASLLHDIGKIGVSESLLRKQNRLSDVAMEAIKFRFKYIGKCLQCKKMNHSLSDLEKGYINKLSDYYELIIKVNQSGFITDAEANKIKEIRSTVFIDDGDREEPLLTAYEYENLSIRHGNLNDRERLMMHMHASHTYDILKDIPWPSDLKRIPMISAAHHEKLDGSGYPSHLKEEAIMFESKLIAIADIFEALTAIDRPYRKSMPLDNALMILKDEAKRNHLDEALVNLFIDKKLYTVGGL